MSDYGFNEIKIYRDQYLGSGAYGIVCKAKCDQLPCAAKLLHPTFLVPGNWAADKFMQECSFLASLKHPHIVQFLGLHTEPSSGQAALLMELMDESLTNFLERHRSTDRTVPLHIQVNMSHDVILALQYLHSNGIIHRDLSSNNILLLGECRAKVTDFGMSKLTCNSSPLSSLTQVPGCPVYMPPEAWISPPIYTEKLDIFSLGVLIVQMITCCLPNPGPLEVLIADERSPTGFMKLPVSEVDRRSEDITQISDHPLKDIALECLTDRAEQRPTSKDLCQKLETLKMSQYYQDSKGNTGQLVNEVPTDSSDSSHKKDSLEKTIKENEMELQKKKEKISTLEREVKSLKEIVSAKDFVIEKLKAEAMTRNEALNQPFKHEDDRTTLSSLSPEVLSIISKDSEYRVFNIAYDVKNGRVIFHLHPGAEGIEQNTRVFLQVYQHFFNSSQLRVEFLPIPATFPSEFVGKVLAYCGLKSNVSPLEYIKEANMIKVISKSVELHRNTTKLLNNLLNLRLMLSEERKLTLKKANIVDEDVSIIVSSANSGLMHRWGVSAAINVASQFEVQKHCNEYVEKHGGLDIGQIAHTKAGGNLKCKWIIHAVGPAGILINNEKVDPTMKAEIVKEMKAMMHRILQRAEKLEATSIAIPAISTGSLMLVASVAAKGILEGLSSYEFSPSSSLVDICVVILRDNIFKQFVDEFIELQLKGPKKTPASSSPNDLVVSSSSISSSSLPSSCRHQ